MLKLDIERLTLGYTKNIITSSAEIVPETL